MKSENLPYTSLRFSTVLSWILSYNAMQSMGYKAAPVVSSCVELLMKGLGASLLIPAYGYLGTCVTEPLTWTLMTMFLVTAYIFQHKKIYAVAK